MRWIITRLHSHEERVSSKIEISFISFQCLHQVSNWGSSKGNMNMSRHFWRQRLRLVWYSHHAVNINCMGYKISLYVRRIGHHEHALKTLKRHQTLFLAEISCVLPFWSSWDLLEFLSHKLLWPHSWCLCWMYKGADKLLTTTLLRKNTVSSHFWTILKYLMTV